MSPTAIGVIGLIILVFLLFSKMWVGATMMLVGFVGCIVLSDFKVASTIVGLLPYTTTANYTLSCMPIFIFMGILISESGLGADLYIAAKMWFGRAVGGLGMATIGACGFFAAVAGDSVTSAVTMSKVSYPEMIKNGYNDGFAAATIAAGGTIGILIPPSICMIIYGLITEESVGRLFMAGMIPGILLVAAYCTVVFTVGKLRLRGYVPQTADMERVSIMEKLRSLRLVWPILFIFLVMLIGMYTGFFTPTEAASIGAAVTFLVCAFGRRLSVRILKKAVTDTLTNSAMIFFLLIGAYIFMRFMALSKLPRILSDTMVTLNVEYNVPRLAILILILVFYIFMGMFMDVFPCILLTLGFVYPVIEALGYSLIWFGVVITRMMEVGMISPPFGLNLFVVSKTTNVPMGSLYRGILPFLCSDIIHIILVVAVPGLSLWLPSMM
jgi:tripartite ATP-independent transporter DctM subunit